MKRMALLRAGFVVWSATWDDVKVILGEAQSADDAFLGSNPRPPLDQLQRRLDAKWQVSGLRRKLGEPTLKLLGRYLAKPDPQLWKRAIFTHLVGEFDQATMASPEFAQRFATAARAALPEGALDILSDGPSDTLANDAHVFAGRGGWRASGKDQHAGPFAHGLADLLLAMPPTPAATGPRCDVGGHPPSRRRPSRARDDFQTAWNAVLHAFNLLQFLPLAWWTTRRGMEGNLYDELPSASQGWMAGVPDQPDGPETMSAWADALWFATEELRADLQRLQALDAPPPEAGFELTGARGGVLAEAELGWEHHRVAVLLTDRSTDRVTFESRGWRVLLAPDDDLADIGCRPPYQRLVMSPQARLAMSSDFLEAYAFLPKSQQRKVRTLITQFTANPTAPGLNYERVQASDNLRSLRIDRSYRAIVLKPDSGSVHLMLWADKHDEAYDWARRHHCRVNPDTGALQVYQPQESPEAAQSEAEPTDFAPQPGPFSGLRDRQLRRLGDSRSDARGGLSPRMVKQRSMPSRSACPWKPTNPSFSTWLARPMRT